MDTEAPLLRLLSWLSPSFPVGAFAYSHGIEAALDTGLVADAAGLGDWIDGIVRFGSGRVDAALLRAAWEGLAGPAPDRLAWAAEWGAAQRGTAETALESSAQGQAFLDTVVAVWPDDALGAWAADLAAQDLRPAYAVAVGAAAARAGVGLRPAVAAYLHALAANLVSAGLRLVPLGQTDGQRLIARLEPVVLGAADAALARDPEDLGAAALMVEWTSIAHETQYTRLFRS